MDNNKLSSFANSLGSLLKQKKEQIENQNAEKQNDEKQNESHQESQSKQNNANGINESLDSAKTLSSTKTNSEKLSFDLNGDSINPLSSQHRSVIEKENVTSSALNANNNSPTISDKLDNSSTQFDITALNGSDDNSLDNSKENTFSSSIGIAEEPTFSIDDTEKSIELNFADSPNPSVVDQSEKNGLDGEIEKNEVSDIDQISKSSTNEEKNESGEFMDLNTSGNSADIPSSSENLANLENENVSKEDVQSNITENVGQNKNLGINGGEILSTDNNEFDIPKINQSEQKATTIVADKPSIDDKSTAIGQIQPEKMVAPVQTNSSSEFDIPEINNDGSNSVKIENPVDEKGKPIIKEKKAKEPFVMTEDAKANRKFAWLSYIFFFIPLLFKKDSNYVRFHANEGLEINIVDCVGILLTVLGKVITPSNATNGFVLSCVFFAGVVTLALTIFSRIFMIPVALSGRLKQTPWFWKTRIIKDKK